MQAHYHLEDIIGSSQVMREVKELAQTYGATDSTILLTGESGTGKEMLAQAIHNLSSRRHGPFVAINCGSITESLLESELFGYVGGTFTGANRDGKVGLFEAANGGTLFLDEVGDMPYVLQPAAAGPSGEVCPAYWQPARRAYRRPGHCGDQ